METKNKQLVSTPNAPAWEGLPYPQAVKVGPWVFVSGQLGRDESTGEAATGIEEQTELVFQYIKAILESAGASMGDVVKTLCYLTNRERDYHKFNQVYEKYITTAARSVAQVA